MIDAWIIVQAQRYTNDGLGGEPMLRITHEAVHFSGGPCKFGRGLEVIGIFETEKVANDYIAYLDQNGVVIYDPPEPIREGELPEGQKPTFRVFLMLEELHRQGYEQLRIRGGPG